MSKPKITPLGDRVLVQHVDEDEQIKGGIIIPDSAKEKSQEAKVVALGTGGIDDSGRWIRAFAGSTKQESGSAARVLIPAS